MGDSVSYLEAKRSRALESILDAASISRKSLPRYRVALLYGKLEYWAIPSCIVRFLQELALGPYLARFLGGLGSYKSDGASPA